MDNVVKKVNLEMKSKMITIFMFENPSYDQNDDLILSKITQKFPSVLLNMDRLPQSSNGITEYLKLNKNPRDPSWMVYYI